jgi:FAD synthetase
MSASFVGDNNSNHVDRSTPLVPESPLSFPDICARIHDRISTFLTEETNEQNLRSVQEQTRISLGVISEALDRYRYILTSHAVGLSYQHGIFIFLNGLINGYSLPEISLSYNGGKDCLVLLILYLSVLHSKGLTRSTTNNVSSAHHEPIQCVYIQAPHPFTEVETFVTSSVATYSLSLDSYAKPMKAAFANYLHDKPSVKAIFVGTRRTDPHGTDLTYFDPTDHGWPEFMRIHPVIEWHYVDIWTVSQNSLSYPKYKYTAIEIVSMILLLIARSNVVHSPPQNPVLCLI